MFSHGFIMFTDRKNDFRAILRRQEDERKNVDSSKRTFQFSVNVVQRHVGVARQRRGVGRDSVDELSEEKIGRVRIVGSSSLEKHLADLKHKEN